MQTAGPFVISILLAFTSCATGSKGYNAALDTQDAFAALAPGGAVYLYMDVPKARPILNSISLPGTGGMDSKQVARVFDRTVSAVAAYYPKTAPRRFLAAARGSYPNFQAAMSFAFSPSWKKQRSQIGDSYWYSAKERLSVSLSPNRAFVSDGDPFVPVPGAAAPEGFASFQQEAVMAGWLDDAAAPINQFLASMELPIEIPGGQVLFGVYQSSDRYEARIRLETSSASQARGLAAIIGMARLFIPPPYPGKADSLDPIRLAGLLFANPPDQEGIYLNLHTGVLSEKEISLLFNMFSIYSN
ncbi:MAG: hypothetical protein LBD55_12700 [Treponema sp.]|nr:hypothetical protein [Treponema sp.]